jgi:hypothetical protein
VTVEYALRNTATPIGVAAFHVTDSLPVGLADSLPTVERLERELAPVDAPMQAMGRVNRVVEMERLEDGETTADDTVRAAE